MGPTDITSTTHLRPHRLQLRIPRPGRIPLPPPEIPKPFPAPSPTLSERRPQRLLGVGLARIASTTHLRQHILQIRLLPSPRQLRPGQNALPCPELRNPLRTPPHAHLEFRRQRSARVGFTRFVSTTQLSPHQSQLHIPFASVGRTALLPAELREPLLTPRRALSERLPQRLSGVGLTRLASTPHLRPNWLRLRIPHPLSQLRLTHTSLPFPELR